MATPPPSPREDNAADDRNDMSDLHSSAVLRLFRRVQRTLPRAHSSRAGATSRRARFRICRITPHRICNACSTPCATACSTAASACARCWCMRRPRPIADKPIAAETLDAHRLRGRIHPRLFAGARRSAGDGRRRSAPRQSDLPSPIRRSHSDSRRRCAADARV